MSLPRDFNEVENLQDIIRLEHNKAVKKYFKNQRDNDVSTPKARLKHSCIIKDRDSLNVALMRLWLFEVTVGHAQSLQAPVLLAPDFTRTSLVKYKPQVQLFFKESVTADTYDPDFRPCTGHISFRLMEETSETISRKKAEQLAKNIKTLFTKPLFIWSKGWYYSSYTDSENGYKLQILSKSKNEARRIIEQVLSIQNHVFNSDNFIFKDTEQSFPAIPPTKKIYGKTRKVSRERPKADVRFQHAKLLVFGLANAINLVDASGRLRSVIERV